MPTKFVSVWVIGMLLLGTATARGPWRASEENTRGWQLMSPAERIEHQRLIRSFTSLASCRSYQLGHHQLMEERARQQGIVLRSGGRDICAHLVPDKVTQ